MSEQIKDGGPVDVLAFLKNERSIAINSARQVASPSFHRHVEMQWDGAVAAIDELIEAANCAYPPGDYSQDAHGYAVRAALARFGSAK